MTTRKPHGGQPPRFETHRPQDGRSAEPPSSYVGGYPPQGHTMSAHPRPRKEGFNARPDEEVHRSYRPPVDGPRHERRTFTGDLRLDGYAHGRPHVGRAAERKGVMRSVTLIGLGLAVILGALGALGLSMISPDVVRDRLASAVKARTGRDLLVQGPASLRIFPSLGVTLQKVSLSAAPGMDTEPLATISALDVSVSLLPLLQREIRVSRLVLHEPVFNLTVDSSGRKSWDFSRDARDAGAEPLRFAQARGTASDAPGGLPSDASGHHGRGMTPILLSQVKLDDVRIENGTVRYADALTGSHRELKAVNVSLALPAISEPLSAKGTFEWNGKTIGFEGALTSIASVLDDRPARLKLAATGEPLEATFEGTASFPGRVDAEGILRLQTSSARGLLHWMGVTVPPSKGFGRLNAKGIYRKTGSTSTFSTADITLDGTTARGDISIDTGGARPRVNASLKLTELDLNTYRRDSGATDAPAPAREAAPGGTGATSIDDLLARESAAPGPRVKGYVHRDGWSEEPYDVSMLGLVDADVKLSIARIFVRDIKVGQSELSVALKNRVMKTVIDDMRLYDGRGRGHITLDGSHEAGLTVGANITLENISGEPLLKDAAGIDKLRGKGRIAFALAGQGENERQLVETLNGKLEASFADGAIIGINIPQMIRGIGKGRFSLGTGPADETDFSEMTSTWSITSGIAQNQDLRLLSPLLRLTGSGTVDLKARKFDYLLKPRIVASLEGQGSAQDQNAPAIEVPVHVTGSWEEPKFTPDLKGLLKDPDAMTALKEIGKQFKGKSASEIANEVLGSGENADAESAKRKAKDLLRQFLAPQ